MPYELLTVACNDPNIMQLDELIFNQGSMYATFSINSLMQALIVQAREHGIDHAIASMNRFLAADCNRCIDVLLLEGISVSETTEIVPNIFLCPLSAVPSSTLQTYLRFRAAPTPAPPFMMKHLFDEEERKAGAALYTIREVRPRFFDKIPTFPSVVEVPAIYQVADLLTVFGPSSPVVLKSYSELADGEFDLARISRTLN